VSGVSTHVLDTAAGRPAAGVGIRLEQGDGGAVLATARTDDDGRAAALGPDRVVPGTYRLVFDTGAYFARSARPCFFPEVSLAFVVTDPEQHQHVPLLLSPFAYSTYRGS
jgi:5-hydroxyisourate hydrolase